MLVMKSWLQALLALAVSSRLVLANEVKIVGFKLFDLNIKSDISRPKMNETANNAPACTAGKLGAVLSTPSFTPISPNPKMSKTIP